MLAVVLLGMAQIIEWQVDALRINQVAKILDFRCCSSPGTGTRANTTMACECSAHDWLLS